MGSIAAVSSSVTGDLSTTATGSENEHEMKLETIAQGRVSLPQLPNSSTALEIPRIAILSRRKRLAHGGDLQKDF